MISTLGPIPSLLNNHCKVLIRGTSAKTSQILREAVGDFYLYWFFFPEKVISFRLLKKLTRNQMVKLKAGKHLVMNLYYPDLINSGDSENTTFATFLKLLVTCLEIY